MNTKLLKQKILDLAIRGKLVPQDPNDEPASELLKSIRAEKEKLIAEGKIKRSKKTGDKPHYENEDTPFEIPKSWEWTNIKEISSSILYGVSESAKQKGEYRLLRITDIQDDKVNWSEVPYTDYDERKVHDYILLENDIVFARTGATVGKSYIVRDLHEKAIYASYLIRVRTSKEIIPKYIKYFFESGYYWDQICMSSVGIGQPNVNGTSLGNLNIPLPPLAEQSRIVAEIERCFALIDTLESNKHDLQEAIKQAKSKALDLAIHGKLVSQDPNDEPASELLKRINPNAAICDISHYPNFPKGWCVLTVGQVADYINGRAFKPNEWEKEGLPIIRIQNLNDEEAIYNYSTAKYEDKYHVHKGDLLFAWAASLGTYIWQKDDAWLNQHIFKVIPKPFIDKEYLYFSFINMIDDFYSESHGSGMVHITKGKFEERPIFIPPLMEQKRIVLKLKSINNIIDSICSEL